MAGYTTEDEWAIYKEFLFSIEGKEYELVGRSIFDLSDILIYISVIFDIFM